MHTKARVKSLKIKAFSIEGGGVAFVWTISGVALAACGTVEDFLGLDDDGGGGRALHVHKSPVQGARIYFDVDGGGVSPAEMAAQDAQYPQGFISDAEGRVFGVPAEFYGMPFEAHLEGAIDADTGESLSGSPVLHSIPNANGDHLLASPITEFLADKFPAEIEVEQLMAEIQPILPTGANQPEDVTAFLEQILDPRNYLDGSSGVEALADYLDGETRTDTDVQTEIADSLPMDTPADTLSVAENTLDPVTLGTNDEFVGKIDAVSHAGAVQYSFVESDGSPANVSDFTISARGVISVVTTPTADTTLYIEVSNTDSDDTETVSVAIMVAASTPELGEVDSGLEETSIVENVMGIAMTGTDLVTGITVTGVTNPDWVIRAPGGFSDKFDVVADGGNWKLVLKAGESLDYEAFSNSNGVFDVEVRAVEGGVRSNALALSVTITDANDAPVFIPATEANRLTDITEPVEVAENARQGHVVARVEAHDADGDSVTYAITTGNTGNAFSIDRNGVISVADADALNFESATKTYTLTITATDSNGATAPQDVTITINITDTNDEAPMVTAPAGTIRTTTGNNDDTPTGYSITVTDADAEATNTFSVIPNDPRFIFERDGTTSTWNLVLLANRAVTAGDFSLGYTATDGANPTTGTIELEAVDTPVRFTAPAAADRTIPLDENNMAGAAVATVMATSSDITGSTTVHIQSFALVDSAGVPVTGGIFNIATSNLSTASASASITITDANALNYEADNSHTIYVLATDTNDEINTLRLTVRVQNLQEGPADYAITEDENNPMLTVALVDSNVDDPDGVVGSVMFRWFTIDGTTKTYLGAASPLNTLDISADPDASYGVTVTYRDGQGMDEAFDVLASSVSFDIVPSYNPATHPLVDGAVPDTNDEVIPPTAISATGGTGKIEYSIDKDNSVGAGAFQINPNDGRLLVSEDRPAMWDYETISSYEIWIVATDVDDGATEGTGDTARHRVVIDVQNVDEGDATYEITQSTTALEIGTVLTAQPVSGMDDPDGVEPGSISYQWSADGTEIDDATGMTYTLKTGDDLNAIYSVEVMYLDGYNAGLAAGDQVPSMAEASTSPIKLAQSSYTGSIREDGGRSNLPTIEASVDDAAMGSAITYAFVTDADADTTNTAHLGFTIGATDGVIRLVSSTLDHETADSITLTVRVTYDSNGATAGGDQETRDIDVPISIGDLNEHAPELLSSLQVATGPGVMGGLPTLAGTANADTDLDGTAAAEYIDGEGGNDEIDGGGGNDHILGGAGNDEITLSSAADNVETIYYRFSSAGSAAWVGSDGVDTIENFRRGEDRLVFIDTDGTPIDLTAFTSASNLGSAGGQLSVKPLFDSATENTLMGVEITFGANKVQINFHSDDDVLIYDEDDDIYTEAAEAYLGARGSDQTFTMGYLESTGLLTDHGLLSAYFGDGDDNLQVTGDDVAALIPSALISERYTSGDGVFARVSARDADGTPNNQVVRYDITDGTGMALFDINSDGWISVKAGATLDYSTATSYTLTITATDGGTPAMTSAEQTITIGILEDVESVYRLSQTGDILTVDLVTPDSDGVVAGSVMYQWFVTDGTSGKQLGGLTTSNTLDTSVSGNELPSSDSVYGVTVTYDDNANNLDQDVVLLLTSVIEGTLGDDTALAGTADADYIVGGSGDDTITSGGGNDHIWGGPGDDTITLSTAVGTVETIYYFFASTDSDPWLGVDGADTINNFRRGEDRLIFIDLAGLIDEGSGIDLGTFLSDDNVFDTGGELAINPLNPELTIDGVEIIFGNQESQKLTISYHTTTREQFHDGTSYTTAGEEYLGTGGTGFDTQTDRLSDNTLLRHYFGDGTHDNLQVTDGEANVIWILNPDITVYPDMI